MPTHAMKTDALTKNPLGVGRQGHVTDMKPGPKPLIVKLPKHGRQSLDISVTETETDSYSHDTYRPLVLTYSTVPHWE